MNENDKISDLIEVKQMEDEETNGVVCSVRKYSLSYSVKDGCDKTVWDANENEWSDHTIKNMKRMLTRAIITLSLNELKDGGYKDDKFVAPLLKEVAEIYKLG